MPSISQVTVLDNYDQSTAIQNQFGSKGGFFSVSGQPVFIQSQYSHRDQNGNRQGEEDWTSELEFGIGAFVAFGPDCIGIRARNAVAGQPGIITILIAAGDEPALQVSALGNITTTNVSTGGLPVFNSVSFGADGTGASDSATSIQNAIAAAETAGGGYVVLPQGGIFKINSTITLANNVILYIEPGAILRWGGAAAGTMITSGSTNPLLQSGVIGGGTIDPNGSAGVVLDLHSIQFCQFSDFDILAGTATTVGIQIFADATNTSPFTGTKNSVYNVFHHIYANGTIGVFLALQGTGAPGVVTLNSFSDIAGEAIHIAGIRFVQWADTNTFYGECRFSLVANNAVGVIWNDSATPLANMGIYNDSFQELSIDTFGVLTGRVGIKLNNCKQIQIVHYGNFPIAEGGIATIDSTAVSYEIGLTSDTNTFVVNSIEHWINNVNFVQHDANAIPPQILANNSGVIPELKIVNLANSGGARLTVGGHDGSANAINGIISIDVGGAVDIGAESNHPTVLISNNTEIARVQSTGIQILAGKTLQLGNTGPQWFAGTGSPSGVVTATRGSIFSRTDGGVGTTLYVSQGGTTWNPIAGV